MRVGSGENTYEWIDSWAGIPETESATKGWAHHGVVVTEDSEVIAYHQGDPTVLVFDRDGRLTRSWETDLTESHGMALAKESSAEFLWIADPGAKRQADLGYEYTPGPRKGQVVKMALDGRTVMRLQRPDLGIYEEGTYSPTSVTVFQEQHGGNGDVWAADGYGESYVHRYDSSGNYIASINGEDGRAGAFNCPHSVWVDTRRADPELYVADRGNSRIQVFDLEGVFKRVFGSEFLTTPSAFATFGELMFVAELRARVTLLDVDDKLICHLGENEAVCDRDGWPNARNEKGESVRPSDLTEGKFNSPHGIAVDGDGNLYVPEWLIGGRFTKLVA